MRYAFIAVWLGCGLMAAAPAGAAGDLYLAATGGLLAGPDTGFLGGVLKVHRDQGGLGCGLEIGYGGTNRARHPTVFQPAIYPPPDTGPRVLHAHLATLMVVGKMMAVNPGGGARLYLSGGAGVQDRLTWYGSSGVLGPQHDVHAVVALGFGLEGTTRFAPTAELRVMNVSSGTDMAPAVGMLVGLGFRP